MVGAAIGMTIGYDLWGGIIDWSGGMVLATLILFNQSSNPSHVVFGLLFIAVILIVAVGLFAIVFAIARRFSRLLAAQMNSGLANLPVPKQSVLGSRIRSWLDGIPCLKGMLKFVLWVIPGVILSGVLFCFMISLFVAEYSHAFGALVLVYLVLPVPFSWIYGGISGQSVKNNLQQSRSPRTGRKYYFLQLLVMPLVVLVVCVSLKVLNQ